MTSDDAHKFLHDFRNALNTVSINVALLRRLYVGKVDPEIIAHLEGALRESEELMHKFEHQIKSPGH